MMRRLGEGSPVPTLAACNRRRKLIQGVEPFRRRRGPRHLGDILRRGHVGVGHHPRRGVQPDPSSAPLRDRDRHAAPRAASSALKVSRCRWRASA